MSPRSKKILFQVGSIVIAVVLLYFAFRGVDVAKMAQALQEANYAWLPVLLLIVFITLALRAWRWQMLLEALPSPDKAHAHVSFKTAFYALNIGLMINQFAPRVGEFARAANLSSQEKLPVSGVFGTVVVERILDVLMLGLILLGVGVLIADRTDVLDSFLLDPLQRQFETVEWTTLVLIGLSVLVLFGFLYWLWKRLQKQSTAGGFIERLKPIFASFSDGLMTVFRAPRRLGIILTTLAMWAAYVYLVHVPFLLLKMIDPYNLSLVSSFVVLGIGTIGFVIPSPGGTGSYHYAVIQTLVLLYAVDRDAAGTYAFFNHSAQVILFIIIGVLCLVLQGSSFASVWQSTKKAEAAVEE